MFRQMRRLNQQISDAQCLEILKKEKRGVLSLLGDDGYPYGIPLNHFFSEEDNKIYFHCAKEGHKIDAIKNYEKASFCVYDSGYRKDGEWALNI
ncbi:MAG: pyridoxamine 5'-phosphate oxidase family protein, partial [Spirochaetia bacterium]|nr:pyridoxamine 5'-phosphate oxidase family protein [Spirochaetia bacterium]